MQSVPKSKLKGKAVRFWDRDGKVRVWRVDSVGSDYLSLKGWQGERNQRVPFKHVLGVQTPTKIRPIDWTDGDEKKSI